MTLHHLSFSFFPLASVSVSVSVLCQANAEKVDLAAQIEEILADSEGWKTREGELLAELEEAKRSSFAGSGATQADFTLTSSRIRNTQKQNSYNWVI